MTTWRSGLQAALVTAPLLLAGCAGRAPQPVYTNPVLPPYWEAEGKAAVRGESRGTNLYFTWTQNGPGWRLVVRGPLGLGRAELHGHPGEVHLISDELDGEVSASSPEELLEMTTRRRAPVSHALHWMKAEPATGRARIERDAKGRPTQIREDGWTVNYLEWSEEAPLLPRRLTVEGPDGRATVVIGLWRLDLDPRNADLDRQGNTIDPGSMTAADGDKLPPEDATPTPPARDPATVLPLPPLDSLPDPDL